MHVHARVLSMFALLFSMVLSTQFSPRARADGPRGLLSRSGDPIVPVATIFVDLPSAEEGGTGFAVGSRWEFIYGFASDGQAPLYGFTRMDVEIGYGVPASEGGGGWIPYDISMGIGASFISPDGWGVGVFYNPLSVRSYSTLAFLGSGIAIAGGWRGFNLRIGRDAEGLGFGAFSPSAAFSATYIELRAPIYGDIAAGLRHTWLNRFTSSSVSESRLWIGYSF